MTEYRMNKIRYLRNCYEDWLWNCDTVSAGYIHRIVHNTVHFIRYKSKGSLNKIANLNNVIIGRSSFF